MTPIERALSNGLYVTTTGKKCVIYFDDYEIAYNTQTDIGPEYTPLNNIYGYLLTVGGDISVVVLNKDHVLKFYNHSFSEYTPNGTKVRGIINFDLV